jgi:hypothetical protein
MTNTLPSHEILVHPHTGLPLQAVGFRRNGAPIWPIIGAAEGDLGAPPVPAPPAGGPPAVPPITPPVEPPAPPVEVRDPAALLNAYNAEKEKRKTAADEARTANEALAALQAKVAGTEAEHAASVAAQRVKDEALGAANARILKAEVRAAATGKLSDPADALLYLDLSKFEVGEDGEVDAKALGAALDDLVKNKPYLAAQGKRFQGNGDGGPRNEDVKSFDDQIAEARKARNFPLAIALEQQRAAVLAASK